MSDGLLQPIYHVGLRPSLMILDDGTVQALLCYESWRQFPSNNFKEMQKANASLIASSPELLEACKAVMNYIGNRYPYEPCIKKCREVIAKAEGRG